VFESSVLTVDHLTSTPLFDAILQADWNGVIYLLQPKSILLPELPQALSFDTPETYFSAPDQAKTWVVCRGEEGEFLWRQLPLHAAICYGAPLTVVEELVKSYPNGLSSADTNGNLPLHLAIQFNSSNELIMQILQRFPKALEIPNREEKLPLHCSTGSDEASDSRTQMLLAMMGYNENLTRRKCEAKQHELEKVSTSISNAAAELKKAQSELEIIKKKPVSVSSKRRLKCGVGRWRRRTSPGIQPE